MKVLRAVVPWVLIAALAFVAWPARWGGWFGWTVVAGDSMLPTLQTGDVVLTIKQQEYLPGEIIVYKPPELSNNFVIHRIVKQKADGSFETQGDNKDTADRWYPTNSDIQGEVMVTIPKCELNACAGLGWPMLLFTILASIAAAIITFELLRNGMWPNKVVVKQPSFTPADEPVWDRSKPPPDLKPDEVSALNLLAAVLRDELVVYFEPSLTIHTGQIQAVEVQARWDHARLGLLKSNVFLPLNEERQLERDFDDWVARAGVRQVGFWRQQGLDELGLFLRMPHAALDDPGREIGRLVQLAADAGLPSHDIVFGMSVQAFVQDAKAKFAISRAVTELGAEVCLHHYAGAGLDPLRRAVDSPFTYVTLDMSTMALPPEPDKSELSRIVTALTDVEVAVIGREVTTVAQVHALAEHGATGYQGPLYCQPVRWETMGRLLHGATGQALTFDQLVEPQVTDLTSGAEVRNGG